MWVWSVQKGSAKTQRYLCLLLRSTTTTSYKSIYNYTTTFNTPYFSTQQNLICSYHYPCLEGALPLRHCRIHGSAQCLPEQQRVKAKVHRSNVTPPATMATIQEGLGPYRDREYTLEAAAGVGVQVSVGIAAEHLVHLRVLTTANQEARRSGSLTLPSLSFYCPFADICLRL